MKARATLRLSYADWSRAVDAGTLPSMRAQAAVLEALIAPSLPEIERAVLDCLLFGQGGVEVTDTGARHIPIEYCLEPPTDDV